MSTLKSLLILQKDFSTFKRLAAISIHIGFITNLGRPERQGDMTWRKVPGMQFYLFQTLLGKCLIPNFPTLQIFPEGKGQEWVVSRDMDRKPVERIKINKEERKVQHALPLRRTQVKLGTDKHHPDRPWINEDSELQDFVDYESWLFFYLLGNEQTFPS